MNALTALAGAKADQTESKAVFAGEQLPIAFDPFTHIPLVQLPLPLIRSISSYLRAIRYRKATAISAAAKIKNRTGWECHKHLHCNNSDRSDNNHVCPRAPHGWP
jgi:hypothetical protein